MNKNYKEIFFDQGYVPNLKIFDKTYADNIYNEYLNFNHQNNNKKCDLVEHKTKTHLYFPWANKIIFEQKILDVVTQIIGDDILCWNSLIFHKKANSKSWVSMHQDQNYWGIDDNKVLTVSLALSSSTVENGCLKLLPGSHKKKFEHKDLNDSNNLLARGQTIDYKKDKIESNFVNIVSEPGECVFFHSNMVHGSYQNNTSKDRVLYAMRFLTPDNMIDKKLYYNYATLIHGNNLEKNFILEPTLEKSSLQNLRKLHKKIIIMQFAKYLRIKVKFSIIVSFFMVFFTYDFFRSIFYSIIKKT